MLSDWPRPGYLAALAATLIGLLALILVESFTVTTTGLPLGPLGSKEVSRLPRRAMERITPLVMTARRVVIPGGRANRMELVTTEDFLDQNYDPEAWVFHPTPALFTYEIFFFDSNPSDPWNPGEIRLMREADFRAHGNNPAPPPGTFAKLAGLNALDPDTTRPGIVEFQVRDMLVSRAFEVRIGEKNYVSLVNGNHVRVKTDHVSLVLAPANSSGTP